MTIIDEGLSVSSSEQFHGRVVLVTGGASGIGEATVRAFHDAGAAVVVADIDIALGERLTTELGSERSAFELLDVRSTGQVSAVVARTVERFGRLDVVFNNAGIGLNAPLVDHTDEQIDDLIAINLRAAILVSRAALPHLVANGGGGVIINNASNGGVVGRAPDPVYVASKHGLVGFTKSLALAHARDQIRVNAICPGPIDTPMVWANFANEPDRGVALHRILATCPDARLASAVEVAAAVLFLASDSARFINGVALPIDGAKAAGVMVADRYRLDFPLSTLNEGGVL